MVAFDFVDDDWAANEPLVIRGWLDVSQFMIFLLELLGPAKQPILEFWELTYCHFSMSVKQKIFYNFDKP